MRYYYFHAPTQQNRGPTTQAGLMALSRIGEVTPDTLVFPEGAKDWVRFADVAVEEEDDVPQPPPTSETQDGGISSHTRAPPSTTASAPSVKALKRKMQESTNIRVDNLPPDVTSEEISAYFTRRCGIIKKGLDGEERIKIYRPTAGEVKAASAIVTFSLRPSVELAIDLYDQSEFAPGYLISVSESGAGREETGGRDGESEKPAVTSADASANATRTNSQPNQYESEEARKKAARTRYLQERHLLSWEDDGDDDETEENEEEEEKAGGHQHHHHHQTNKVLRVVVLKHMFDPEEMAKEGERLTRELHEDLVEGFAAEDVRAEQITLFKRHPEGVVVVRTRTAGEAERAVKAFNNRYFDGRRIRASMWDGVTLYGSPEDREEEKREEAKRIEDFAKWLEGGEEEEEEEKKEGM